MGSAFGNGSLGGSDGAATISSSAGLDLESSSQALSDISSTLTIKSLVTLTAYAGELITGLALYEKVLGADEG